MGVVLLSCTTKRETTKARIIACCSLSVLRRSAVRKVRSNIESGLAVCSSTIAVPHEYLALRATY
jgi:hypothetical protein